MARNGQAAAVRCRVICSRAPCSAWLPAAHSSQSLCVEGNESCNATCWLLPTRTMAWENQRDMPASNTTGKHILDVHHGVGVLAGVGLGSTAGAGRNGHTMLPTGHVTPHWNIQGWVGVKEPKGLQEEAHMLSRHNWPILNPRDVSHPK